MGFGLQGYRQEGFARICRKQTVLAPPPADQKENYVVLKKLRVRI